MQKKPLNPLPQNAGQVPGTFPNSEKMCYSPFRGLGGKFAIRHSQFAIFSLLLALTPLNSSAWGFWAHKKINREAVKALPTPMLRFYQNNADYLSLHAIDADRKRYVDSSEAPKHYIDLDRYGKYPYLEIPRKWKDAREKFGEKKLDKNGTLPWQINYVYHQLVDAFKKRDSAEILRLSANIGHYIADATVPLHTTRNYDGQLSKQNGIHSLWERYIPEQFGDKYKCSGISAIQVKDIQGFAWGILLNSNLYADTALRTEKQLQNTFHGNKYLPPIGKDSTSHIYSPEYVAAYNDVLNGMVEKRFRSAVCDIASVWMSAWVEAGKPNLNKPFKKLPHKEENLPDNIKTKEE